jgi:uncharacterized protein (TIGR02118 family)
MIKLRASWNIPGDRLADEADAEYFETHVPRIRDLPGLRAHALLKYLRDAAGGPPAWWRGEELFFEDLAALERAAASAAWSDSWASRFSALVAGPRWHAFEIEEEFEPSDADLRTPGVVTALSGIWQVPALLTPEEVDPVYLEVHVPNVRKLPRLRRHTVMKAFDWPAGEYSRAWRSAEIRFDSGEDFDAVFDTPAYDAIRKDGFNASVAGPDVDIYAIEQEWRA